MMKQSSAFKCVTVALVALAMFTTFVHGSPMMYKKNDQKNYEADLIPVSSTVIPLTVYEVSYGSKDGKLTEEEYKKIYIKHFHKKAHHQPGVSDKLITAKTKKE